MKLLVDFCGLTHVGRVRKANEDNWMVDPEGGLFVVADGMGGEFAGALASKAVVEVLPSLVRRHLGGIDDLSGRGSGRQLGKAIAALSMQLRRQTENEPGLAGMGSTVVCALVRGERALVAHMGDSRAYRWRGGRLRRLTTDHTFVRLLLDSGDIAPEEEADNPARGRLTRSVGMDGGAGPQTRLVKLHRGDLLLLCTDGLTGMLDDSQIQSILSESVSLETKCRCLVEAANEAGGTDNVTVLLLHSQGTGKVESERMPRRIGRVLG